MRSTRIARRRALWRSAALRNAPDARKAAVINPSSVRGVRPLRNPGGPPEKRAFTPRRDDACYSHTHRHVFVTHCVCECVCLLCCLSPLNSDAEAAPTRAQASSLSRTLAREKLVAESSSHRAIRAFSAPDPAWAPGDILSGL